MMDHAKKMEFVHKMTKLGLQHFDAGGTVAPGTLLTGPSTPGTTNNATNPNSGIAGSIGQALGLNNNFQAGSANIQAGTNATQLNNAYTGAQEGLNNETSLANTLQPQAGAGVGEQNMLAAQLENEANGQGPNVAQNELNQATGANVASGAALAAGQRGSSSNAGLIARQVGQQTQATNQNAAGQAATLGAQQQIAAQSNLGNLAGTEVSEAGQAVNNESSAQQGEQNILENANTSFNNAGVGMQSDINNVNAQTSAANQNMASNIFGGVAAGAGSVLSGLGFADGGEVGDDNEGAFEPSSSSASNGPEIPSTASLPANSTNLSGSGGSAGAGAAIAMLAAAKGGQVKKPMQRYAGGGISGNPLTTNVGSVNPQSFSGQWLSSSGSGAAAAPNVGGAVSLPKNTTDFSKSVKQGIQNYKNGQKTGNTVSQPIDVAGGAMDNTGDLDNDPANTPIAPSGPPSEMLAAKGGPVKNMAARGGNVTADSQAERATVSDNSYSNDKIPALLSEKEIVLPREITTHPNAPAMAAEFVRRTLAKKGLKRGLA